MENIIATSLIVLTLACAVYSPDFTEQRFLDKLDQTPLDYSLGFASDSLSRSQK